MVILLRRLKREITSTYRCQAEHEVSRLIVERLPNGEIWRSQVHAFKLTGHPKASRCYAWAEQIDGCEVVTTMLRTPPVYSAQSAVQRAHARRAEERMDLALTGFSGGEQCDSARI